jgi:hypothetical protein
MITIVVSLPDCHAVKLLPRAINPNIAQKLRNLLEIVLKVKLVMLV